MAAVERDRGVELGRVDGKVHRHPAAEAEPDRAQLAVAVRVFVEEGHRGQEIGPHFRAVSLPLHRPAFVVIARIAAERIQRIRCKSDEAGRREAARHVFDIRIQAAILVDHDDAGPLVIVHRRPNEISWA